MSLYTQERDLRDMFSKWGPVDEVQIVYDHQSGRSRGFAFIYMHNVEDATDVSLKLQDRATFYIYLMYQDDLTTEKRRPEGFLFGMTYLMDISSHPGMKYLMEYPHFNPGYYLILRPS